MSDDRGGLTVGYISAKGELAVTRNPDGAVVVPRVRTNPESPQQSFARGHSWRSGYHCRQHRG